MIGWVVMTDKFLFNAAPFRMHPLSRVVNNPGYTFYRESIFEKEVIRISVDVFQTQVMTPLLGNSATFIHERSLAAINSARRNHGAYGIADANKVGVFEACVEALTDGQYRKGSLALVCKRTLRDQIEKAVCSDGVVEIALQMLPNKVNTPIKSRRGAFPCLSEVSLLLRLHEICSVAEAVCQSYGRQATFRFRCVMDGFRFQSALNILLCDLVNYQSALSWWINTLGLQKHILLHDYETEIRNHVPTNIRVAKKRSLQYPVEDMVGSLLRDGTLGDVLSQLSVEDPFGEYECGEGKLQKLFKSILYTYHHHDLEDGHKDMDSYQDDYRGILRNVYDAGADIKSAHWRQKFIECTLHASVDYMSSVHADSSILGDPVKKFFPGAIRMNLLPKKDQIGLNPLCTKNIDSLKPWHGVCFVRRSKNNTTKIDSVSRLYAEGIGAVPVAFDPHDATLRRTPLGLMADNGQTLFYLEPGLLEAHGNLENIFKASTRYTT